MKREIDGDDINNEQVQVQQEQEGDELRRGPWTLDEDNLLTHYVACHGEGRWNLLAKSAGLKRTGKSCRLRWLNYLKPDIKRGNLSPQEQLLILELHSKWGNRWSKIASHLPGRTDNEIKNYWRTRVQKQAKQLNMESNSPSFIDAIRCFYMPRLIQKIEQSSTTSSTTIYSDASPSSSASQITNLLSANHFAEINLDNSLDTSCSNVSLSSTSELPDLPSSATSAYDMDLASMSAAEIPFTDCHVGGQAWPWVDDMEDDSFYWDLDEIWQFKK